MRKIISVILAMVVILSSFTAITVAADEAALGPNIATGKKVTAAGQFSEAFGIAKAVDGNINTTTSLTMAQVLGEKIDGYNKLVVDLGSPYELTNITVRSRRDKSQGRKGWVLEVASEATYEDKVIVGEKPTSGEFGSDLIVNFSTPIIARYILFYGISGAAEIGEIEAYGTPFTGKEVPNYKDIKEANYNAAKLVECLGIMQGVSTSEFGVNKLIRRDEAAKLIAIAAGLSAQEGVTSSFADVLADNEYIPYIEACLGAGLISKSDTYRPQDFVRGTEILKMLTYAMGYDSILPNLGEYPHNVLKLSKDLGITKGVEKISTDVASREDVLRAVYNALITPTSVIDEFSENILYYKNGPSFLKQAFGLELKKGVVTENDVTNLIEAKSSATNAVKIDGVQHIDETGALHDLIGQLVYYVCDGDKVIVGGWTDTQKQVIKTIYSKDIVFSKSSDDYIVVSDEEENEEEYSIDSNPYVLKNGVAYDDYTIDKLNVDSGKILLIDHDGDYTFDVIHIFEPKILIASHAATGLANRVLVSGSNGESVVASDYKYLVIKNGTKKVDTTAIMVGDLVYAYESENKKNYIFEIVRNTVSGILEEVASDGLVVDDEKYGYSSYYLNNKDKLPKLTPGLKATFAVDEHGDIIWVSNAATKSDSELYAVTMTFKKPQVFENAELMLFTEKSEILTLKFADTVRIDGKKYSQDDLNELITKNPSYLLFKLTRYNTNVNGEITKMVTENSDELKRSDVPSVSGNNSKRTSTGIFNGQNMILTILEDFPIFVVPTTSDYSQLCVGEEYEQYYSMTDSAKEYPKGTVSIAENQFKVFAKDEYDSPSIGMFFEPIIDATDHAPVKSYQNAPGLVVDSLTKAQNANGSLTYNIKGYDINTGKKTDVVLHEELLNVINIDRLHAQSDDLKASGVSTNTNFISLKQFDEVIAEGEVEVEVNGVKVKIPKNEYYLSPVKDLARGDIIRYQLVEGMATMIERVYTKADHVGGKTGIVYTAGDNHPNFASHFRLSNAILKDYKNNIMTVDIGEDKLPEIIPCNNVTGDAYLVTSGRITKCTVAELPMYISEGAKMAIYGTKGNYHSFVIFMD